MPDRPTGTITFLFTDIEGSTNLLQDLGERYVDALAAHFEILREALTANGGVEQTTEGDSLFAVFPGAVDAVRAAIEAQRRLSDHEWPESTEVRVRMGIHSGEAAYGPDGYVGLDVHRAARISTSANGGQIIASASTVALAGPAMPSEASFRDLGSHRLKDLRAAEQLSQVIADGLDVEFPPLRSLDVVPHNLPVQLTSFIGRDHELADIASLLANDRIVTLTGVGGTGKTRLAFQSAASTVHEFPDGVWAVDLAPVTALDMVDNALAAAMGVRDQPGRSLLATITDVLREKRALLLLDNCEHLLDAVADLVTTILQVCPGVKALTTSREAIGLAGEAAYAVPSLGTPPPVVSAVDDLLQYDSVVLFVERAALVRPGFALTDDNAGAVAQICRRLDAVPLAIELAAARVRVLSPLEIADRLDDRFRLLTGGDRTAMPRQQTLEATVAWSYDHLAEGEQMLFTRLGVTAGSFTLEAAEAVAGGEGIDERDVLDLLAGLVDKSMVTVDTGDHQQTRYRILETLRQYARSRLVADGTVEEYRRRHARFFEGLAEEGGRHLRGPGQREWFRKLEREHDNLSAALTWSLGAGEPELLLRTAGALGYVWSELGHWEEGRRWLLTDPVFDDARPPDLRARALVAVVGMMVPENPERARDLAQQAVDLSREAGDELLVAYAILAVGYATLHMFHQAESVPILEEGLAMMRHLKDRWGEALALGSLANAFTTLDSERARDLNDQSQRIFEELGDELLAAESFYRGAAIANRREEPDQAIASSGKALDLYRSLGANVGEGHALLMLGRANATLRRPTEARGAFASSVALLDEAGDAHCGSRARRRLGLLDLEEDDVAAAATHLRSALEGSVRVGDKINAALSLEALGRLAAVGGDPHRGTALFGAAKRRWDSIDTPRSPEEARDWQQGLDDLRMRLGSEAFDAAWQLGVGLSLDDAVDYGLA